MKIKDVKIGDLVICDGDKRSLYRVVDVDFMDRNQMFLRSLSGLDLGWFYTTYFEVLKRKKTERDIEYERMFV